MSDEDVPSSYDVDVRQVDVAEVKSRLQKMSKAMSLVPGDIPYTLFKHYSSKLAPVVTAIFNKVLSTNEWPSLWSTEYVSVIPKVTSPETMNKCRNISCTNFLSKVL